MKKISILAAFVLLVSFAFATAATADNFVTAYGRVACEEGGNIAGERVDIYLTFKWTENANWQYRKYVTYTDAFGEFEQFCEPDVIPSPTFPIYQMNLRAKVHGVEKFAEDVSGTHNFHHWKFDCNPIIIHPNNPMPR